MLSKIVFVLIFILNVCANDAAILMDKVYSSNRNKQSKKKYKMYVKTDNNVSERTFTIYEKINKIFDSESLVIFDYPLKYKNIKLLTKNNLKIKEADQWIYLPALKKTRRINSTNRLGSFVGSHLYFIDLQNRSPALDDHKIIQKKNNLYTVVESRPRESGLYEKVVSRIDTQKMIPIEVVYYIDGKKDKVLKIEKIVKIDDVWEVEKFVIEKDSGDFTRVEVVERDLNSKFSNEVMSQYRLEKDF